LTSSHRAPQGPPRTVAGERERLRGLTPAQAAQLRRVMQLLAAGDRMMASLLLLELARSAPDHPEVLRLQAQRHLADQEWAQAADCLARSHAQRPGDFGVLLQLGAAQDQAGDHAAAPQSLRAAAACAGPAGDWLALSLEFDRQGYVEDALSAVEQALLSEPRLGSALLQRARCAMALGQAEKAAADCRRLIAQGELVARAWFMLADLKVVPLDAAELARLEQTAGAPPPSATAEERVMLLFALGKALEDAGRFDEAFAALQRANQAASATRPWDGVAFAGQVAAIQAAFDAAAPAPEGELGREVIFLVGLPRSGTTLVEQVLASHSQVEGASELPYLGRVIEQESRRRGRPFAAWAAVATADDWQRLGRAYLDLSARWRMRRPVATDKLPENWLFAAAALRMLPGARVIDCRRDAVETCWSCYKQLFGPGMVHFSYSFEGLAGYWHTYDGLTRHWAQRHAGRFFQQNYEALVQDPEGQIRGLLQACGLPFEAACLDFHLAQRAIRTPSALQVRQPMRQASTPGARYGELLDPLRRLLAVR
jgi:tetratricopeptide (TPR) repeat protein